MKMLGFRPLPIGKRKTQSYNQLRTHEHDIEKAGLPSDSDGDDEAYPSSAPSSAYSSRQSSASYDLDVNPNNLETSPLRPRRSPPTLPSRPRLSKWSPKNPRMCTRYFGLAVASTLLLFVWFLLSSSWDSARAAELKLNKMPEGPKVWEEFAFLKRYHGGVRRIGSEEERTMRREYPRVGDMEGEGVAEEEQKEGVEDGKGKTNKKVPKSMVFDVDMKGVKECYLDVNETIKVPALRGLKGVPEGMPDPVLGSYDVLGLRNDMCFDRFGRLGPYGLGYSKRRGGTGAGMEGDREGIEEVWAEDQQVDFRQVNWAEVLDRCLEKNEDRFDASPSSHSHSFQEMNMGNERNQTDDAKLSASAPKYANSTTSRQAKTPGKKLSRTAVLLRTWSDYNYSDEDLLSIRALISELSLASGGQYHVHFLIHVKDDNKQIWADESIYADVLRTALPAEFTGMGTLWSERQMFLLYGGLFDSHFRDLPVHGVYRSTYMPVTYFAHQHPEFEHIWNWEMDVRYTGHYLHLLTQLDRWTTAQPRKGLWERNARFYIPSIHGDWSDFSHMVRVQSEHGVASTQNLAGGAKWPAALPPNSHIPSSLSPPRPEPPIWGPYPPQDYPDIPLDSYLNPSTPAADDKYTWGTDETADLITLSPLFSPSNSGWLLADDITGYERTHGAPPTRASIGTTTRLSRRLLAKMHTEHARHRHAMASEMWPGSVALHYGFKAVFAPHPVYIDRAWPVPYLASIFNGGANGGTGGAGSVFGEGRKHNLKGVSWFYDAGFGGNLWRRWLGYRVDGDGGEEEEMSGEGRMCLPPVLLHPVKDMRLVSERGGEPEW